MATGTKSSPQRPAVIITDPARCRSAELLLVLLAVCYVLQVFSPLRLNNDAIALLSMAESAAHGGGFLDGGQKTVFPPGYPALLAVLLTLGFAHPWVIVSLNIIFLSVGLFATYSLLVRQFFEDKTLARIICSFFLLSWVIVKHFTIPLSDVPFFCCSMCCLAVMSRTTKADSDLRFVILAVAAWLLAVAAITVRRVGVALVPPLVFMIVCSPQFKLLLRRLPLLMKLIIVVVSVFVCIETVRVVTKTSSLSDFHGVGKGVEISTLALRILSYRFTELGELVVNLPLAKMPAILHVMVPWTGLLLFLLTLFGLATKQGRISPTQVFLVCYIGILFVWPYYDARFWLPVIPLLIAYSVLAVARLGFLKGAATIYCVVFAILGFVAIAYTTRISFAGCKFPDRYGDGNLRPTYRVALQCQDAADPSKVNAKVLRLLQEYK